MNKFTLALVIAMVATTGIAGGIPNVPATTPAPPPELLFGGLSVGAAAAAAAALLLVLALVASNSTISTVSTD